jgi:hypothetical protein
MSLSSLSVDNRRTVPVTTGTYTFQVHSGFRLPCDGPVDWLLGGELAFKLLVLLLVVAEIAWSVAAGQYRVQILVGDNVFRT